jgi:hypothetical protein
MDGPVFKIRNDPRVTRVGRWLRRFSLDESPQLWSVLRGDMILVGPRPLRPHEIAGHLAWQRRRLSMRPGLTCLWQYIDSWSMGFDLRIQPGDGLTVKFAYHPLRDLEVSVRPDGRISIPFAEEVHIAGLTVAEADARLTAGVAEVLRDPQLTIVVTTVARSQVYVGGAMVRPGAVPLVRTFIADVGLFVGSHINAIIPRAAIFTAFYNLDQPDYP